MFGSKISVMAGFTALVFSGFAASASAIPSDPVATLKKKDSELQKMLRDKESAKKTDKLKVMINGIFDFEELGKRALGPDLWKSMKPEQQSHFVKAFKGMVENASVKKLEVYQSDSTIYEKPEITDNKATVTTHVFSKGTESIVTYKLQANDSTWKAWDLVIDDLSTARNYGEQFRKILQTSNMDGLIAKLDKKNTGTGDAKPTSKPMGEAKKSATKSAAPAPAPAPAKIPAAKP